MIVSHQHFDLLGKLVLEHVVFHPPLKASEAMQNEACLIYAVNGQSTIYGGTEQGQLTSGESVLIKCGTFINHWQVSDAATPYEAVAIHLYPEVLNLVYENRVPDFLKGSATGRGILFQKMEAEALIKHFIDGLLFYFENPALLTRDLLMLKLKELILLLYQTNSNGIREMLADLFNPEELAFKEVIRRHVLADLSVEDFAELTNLSLSSFKRKFKAVFNESPARYIKHQRLERAAELLRMSNKRITEICFDCGFNDPASFSKSFAQKYGQSPSAYQKAYLG